jgi:hypothetical protein
MKPTTYYILIIAICLILFGCVLLYYRGGERKNTKDYYIGHDAGGLNVSSAIRGYQKYPSSNYYTHWVPGYNNTSVHKDWIYDNKICKNVNTVDGLITCFPEIKEWPVDSYRWREIRPIY